MPELCACLSLPPARSLPALSATGVPKTQLLQVRAELVDIDVNVLVKHRVRIRAANGNHEVFVVRGPLNLVLLGDQVRDHHGAQDDTVLKQDYKIGDGSSSLCVMSK